jgi:ubiquinone/menaquinone biosynthesis C-methylase UbiE
LAGGHWEEGGGAVDGSRSGSFTQVSVPDGYDRFMLRQLFEPWAADLITRANLKPRCCVLDVASGLGPVARLAAQAAGPGGRVVASDISAAMLAVASARPHDPGWAAIEYLQCPASEIAAEDDTFDVVLCQQGLQFFPDRAAAAAEMRRVARPGGTAAMSTWAAEHPLGLFGPMVEALQDLGVAEPFAGAFDAGSYCLTVADLADLLRAVGFRDVGVQTVELDATWPTAEAATSTLLGTPFGPMVSALPADAQQELRARLAGKLGASDDGVTVRTVSNVALGTK